MLEQASELQRKIYEFITSYMKTEGKPPTIREMCQALGIASTSHVDHHLKMLEKRGLIERQPKKSRGIKLVKEQPVVSTTPGIPIMGTIAAGQPIDIFDDVTQTLDIDSELGESENCYALVVKGRSMIEEYICDGDYVVIKPQTTCQNGDIVVATHLLGGVSGSSTLKRFFLEKGRNRVRLQPANAEMEPIFVPKGEWDREWKVQGKVIAVLRRYSPSL